MICYVDAFSGLAGDMLVGAFVDTFVDAGVDAGAPQDEIVRAIAGLGAGGTVSFERVSRRGISATKFRVQAEQQSKHQHLSGILEMIADAELPDAVQALSARVFQRLAEAESAVHGISVEKVHFHEVGAIDSIADIVGACLAMHLTGVTRLFCSAINVGSGTVSTEHGILPVPAPATARLLRDCPIYSRGPALELTTPTGAAFVAALAEGFGAMPAMKLHSAGYGAGDRNFKEHANVLRVLIGEASGASESTTVCVLQANIDDASPQVIAYALEKLLDAGALDATVIPAQMKKGRPGVVLEVIAPLEKREELASILFRETTTLGLRFHNAERRVQSREWVDVQTRHGALRMKTSPEGFAPEYEDARRLALETGVPLKEILAEATYEYLRNR